MRSSAVTAVKKCKVLLEELCKELFLTYRDFLVKYQKLLETNHGEVHFKTDNRKLFEFSLNEFCELTFKNACDFYGLDKLL